MPDGLTDAERKWIARYSGRYPDDAAVDAAMAQVAAVSAAREASLEEARGYLEAVRAELHDAQDGLGLRSGKTVTPILNAQGDGIRAEGEVEARDVRQGDVLTGADGADLDKMTAAPEAVARLTRAHARLVEVQQQMEAAVGPDGMPLFTKDEIRAELWTPLVREGVIPEGSVADAYSEQAIAASGAMALYQDQIAAYSKEHTTAGDTGRQVANLLRGTAELVTAGVQFGIAMDNASDLGEDYAETSKLHWKKLTGQASDDELATLSANMDRNYDVHADVVRQQNAAAAIGTFVIAGIDAVEGAANIHASEDTGKKMQAAKLAFETVAKVLPAAIDVWHAGRTPSGASRDQEKTLDAEAKYIKLAMKSAFASARVLPRLYGAAMGSEQGRLAECAAAVDALADAVAFAYAAGASKSKSEGGDSTEAARTQRYGQQVATLIRASGKAPALLAAIHAGDGKKAALILGAGALMAVGSVGVADEAVEALAEPGVESGSAGAVNRETAFDAEQAARLEAILAGATSLVDRQSPEDDALEAQFTQEMHDAQMKAAEEAVENLSSPETVEEIRSEIAAELLEVEEMYSKAMPQLDVVDPEELAAAHAALDKAMAQGAELNTALTLVEMVADGGLGVLASVYPGVSIAIAGKKLIKDGLILKKKIQLHNDWVDVMKTAVAGQGGAASAIENALHNAKVHRNTAGVDAVFSMLKVGSATISTLDPSGIGLAVSGAVTMASALNTAVQRAYSWNEVRKGWNAYKAAKEDPANRRLARAALRLNSTLAKCCIAYGATELNDPAAKQAMMASGLSIAAIQNDDDICVRLVAYLQKELADDVDVLKVELSTSNAWYPGKPELTLTGWRRFVSAAAKAAPPLHSTCLDTPGVDRLLAQVAETGTWPAPDSFPATDDPAFDRDAVDAAMTRAQDAAMIFERLEAALGAYKPLAAGEGGTALSPHQSMAEAVSAFGTLARWSLNRARADEAALQQMLAP